MNPESIREELLKANKLSFIHPEEALQISTRMIVEARNQGLRDLELLAITNLAVHQADLGNWQKALTYSSLGVRLGRDARKSDLVIQNLALQALLQFRTLKLADSFESAMLAVKHIQPKTPPDLVLNIIHLYAFILTLLENEDSAYQLLQSAITLSDELHADAQSRLSHSIAAVTLAWEANRTKSSDKIELIKQHIEKGKTVQSESEESFNSFFYQCAVYELLFLENDYASAKERSEKLLELAPKCGQRSNLHWYIARAIQLADHFGKFEEAHLLMGRFYQSMNGPVARVILPKSINLVLEHCRLHGCTDEVESLKFQWNSADSRLTKAKEMSRLAFVQFNKSSADLMVKASICASASTGE